MRKKDWLKIKINLNSVYIAGRVFWWFIERGKAVSRYDRWNIIPILFLISKINIETSFFGTVNGFLSYFSLSEVKCFKSTKGGAYRTHEGRKNANSKPPHHALIRNTFQSHSTTQNLIWERDWYSDQTTRWDVTRVMVKNVLSDATR